MSRGQSPCPSTEVHAILEDVPLKDVSAIDLPGGGAGRTLNDLRAPIPTGELQSASPLARGLFALRLWLGRLFGWDRPEYDQAGTSYLSRITPALRARSVVQPGTREGGFRLLFVLERESLAEDPQRHRPRFSARFCARSRGGYRLYWGRLCKTRFVAHAGVHGVH